MENLTYIIGYNFGITVLTLIILTVAFNYFYLKKFKEKTRRRVHALESRESDWRLKATLRKEIISNLREDLAETEELCYDFQEELWENRVRANLRNIKLRK